MTLGGSAMALAWRPPWMLHVLYTSLTTWVLVSHATAEWDGTAPGLRGAGTLVAVGFATLVLSAVAVRVSQSQGWPSIALRAVGSWLAALGFMLLALRV